MEQKNNLVKWINLGYISFFIISLYLLLQFLLTALFVFIYEIKINHIDTVRVKGYQLELDDIRMNIWQLPEFYLSLILSSLMVLVLIYHILKRQNINYPFRYLGFNKIDKNNLIWLVYSLIFALACYSFWHLTGANSGLIRTPDTFYELVLVFFGAVIFVPVIEEIIFRGFLLKKMNELLKKDHYWISVMITSFLFSIIHFKFSFVNLAFLFVVGCFLAFMKLKTNNLWFPVLFHSFGNLVTLVLFYFL